MKVTIAVIPGDGIGPEVIAQAKKALEAVAEVYNHVFLYKEAQMGACAIDETGTPLPDATIDICKKADAVLFGAIGDPKYDNDPTAKIRPEQGLLRLRQELGLYCNVRPVKAYEKLIKIALGSEARHLMYIHTPCMLLTVTPIHYISENIYTGPSILVIRTKKLLFTAPQVCAHL